LAGYGLVLGEFLVPIRRKRSALGRLLALAMGFGLEGAILLGLGVTGLLRPAPIAVLTACGLALLALRRRALQSLLPGGIPGARGGRLLSAAPFLLLAFTALSAFAPDTAVDDLAWHLPYAGLALWTGWLPSMPFNVIWHFPAAWETALIPPLLMGGESAARLMGTGIAGLTLLLIINAVPRGTAFGGRLAGLLFTSSTLVAVFMPSCKNDLPAGMLSFASFLAGLWALRARGGGPAFLAGALAGFALGTKFTSLMPAAATLAMLVWEKNRGRNAGAFLLAAAVFFAPWGARGFLEKGDPFYPLTALQTGAGISPALRDSFARESLGNLQGNYSSAGDRLRIPYTLAQTEQAAVLPALLIPALLLLWRFPAGTRWWALQPALAWLAWSLGPPQPRYLMSALPVICGTLELAPLALAGQPALRTAFLAVVGATGVLEYLRTWAALPERKLAEICVATGLLEPARHREAFLLTWDSASRWANASLPANARPLFLGELRSFPVDRGIILPSVAEPGPMLELANGAGNERRLGIRARQLGITHFIYNRTRSAFIRERLAVVNPPLPALRVWASWFRGHARAVYSAPTVSAREGSYYIYELVPGGANEVLNLPGVEGYLYPAEVLLREGKTGEAQGSFEAVAGTVGPLAAVDFARATLFEAVAPPAETRARLEKADRAGLRSVSLLLMLARYADKSGDRNAAQGYLKRAQELDPAGKF
jgi:hypothetical protein